MSEQTGIQWTNHTFNIAWGCEKLSPACKFCYAEKLSGVYGFDVWGKNPRRTLSANYWKQPRKWHDRYRADGGRGLVFCSSMCDVFEDHPTIRQERAKLWPLIYNTPYLDWQLLTKRHDEMAEEVLRLDRESAYGGFHQEYPNVWAGCTAEDQEYYTKRCTGLARLGGVVPILWLSMEPLLGPVEDLHLDDCLDEHDHYPWGDRLKWVILGGESGTKAECRPFDLDWARAIIAELDAHGIAVFVKQLGDNPHEGGKALGRGRFGDKGGDYVRWPRDLQRRAFPEVKETA